MILVREGIPVLATLMLVASGITFWVSGDGRAFTAAIVFSAILASWGLRGFLERNARARVVAREREARQAAEAATEAKSQFVASLSHEIRTPMTGVVGMAAALDATELSPSQAGMVATLRASGESMVHLLNAVLDFSRIEAGHMVIDPAPFDLRELLERLHALNAAGAADKGIGFVIDDSAIGDGRVMGDAERVRQVLQNLITNAIKFTAKGTVSLTAARSDDDVTTIFKVSDTGIGMTPATAARVFEPYEQGTDGIAQRFGGTGLGLTISRELINLMGGSIALETAAGKGSTFTVSLPLPRDETQAAQAPRSAPASLNAAGRRILIADDSLTNVRVMMALLRRTGAEITAVTSGPDAIAAHAERDFDLLLLDINMPGMSGIQALRTIRKQESANLRSRVPAIAFTGFAFDHEVQQIMIEDFDAHLAKPVDVEQFFILLERFLPKPVAVETIQVS